MCFLLVHPQRRLQLGQTLSVRQPVRRSRPTAVEGDRYFLLSEVSLAVVLFLKCSSFFSYVTSRVYNDFIIFHRKSRKQKINSLRRSACLSIFSQTSPKHQINKVTIFSLSLSGVHQHVALSVSASASGSLDGAVAMGSLAG